MAEIKTKQTEQNVTEFIKGISDEQTREDCFTIVTMMKKASGENPKMWGTSLIGFGFKRYKSPTTSREVDWFKLGFSPRKANLSLHLVLDLKQQAAALKKLGKYKAGKGCIYIKKLSDVNLVILDNLIDAAVKAK